MTKRSCKRIILWSISKKKTIYGKLEASVQSSPLLMMFVTEAMLQLYSSYTLRFDKVELEKVIENVNDLPDPELDEAVRESFDVAYSNIYAFHASQKPVEKVVENMEGVRCKRVARRISSVGLYVPGGTAVLSSTALMLAIRRERN